jgi:hypothetical protein
LVKKLVRQARDVELRRLERAPPAGRVTTGPAASAPEQNGQPELAGTDSALDSPIDDGLDFTQDFHFGLPDLIQYKPNRHPLAQQTTFSLREPFSTLQDRAPALLAKSKTANSRLFNAFHKHVSGLHALVG